MNERNETLSQKEIRFFQEQERVFFSPGEEGQGVRWGLPGQEATIWKVIFIDLTTFSVEQDWEPSCQLQELAHRAGDEAWRVGGGRILPRSNWQVCRPGDKSRNKLILTQCTITGAMLPMWERNSWLEAQASVSVDSPCQVNNDYLQDQQHHCKTT